MTILAASNNPGSLDHLGLYTIMLAKRTGMKACLLFVLQKGKNGNCSNQGEKKNPIQEKTSKIQEIAAKEQVRIDCLMTTGLFVEEVAKYIRIFDSPILIVGEGECKFMRKKELRLVKQILKSRATHFSGRSPHFLVISGKNKPDAPITDTSSIGGVSMNHFLKAQ